MTTGRALRTSGVTPIVLCRDEEANLARTLSSLGWAERVVVVDSGSTDRSREIAESHANVSWFAHPFEGFGAQWTFAIHETGVTTPFVLSLDADMSVSPELANEAVRLSGRDDVDGARIAVTYAVQGVPLNGSLYPAQVRLFRPERTRVVDVGHGHTYQVSGNVVTCRGRLLHDDRKSLERFVAAQLRYSAVEAAAHRSGDATGAADAIRKLAPFAPLMAWCLAYLRSGGPFRGAASSLYAAERLIYEALLRYRLDDEKLRAGITERGEDEA